MKLYMPLSRLLVAACTAWLSIAVYAATPGGSSPSANTTPSAQEVINALTKAQSAVVGVQVTAAEGARSIETLGKQRLGSGVVIGDGGLIVTIGYLILEADNVEITTTDKKTALLPMTWPQALACCAPWCRCVVSALLRWAAPKRSKQAKPSWPAQAHHPMKKPM
jgi:hypothetical protein